MDPNLFRLAHQPDLTLLVASSIEAQRFRSGAVLMPVAARRAARRRSSK